MCVCVRVCVCVLCAAERPWNESLSAKISEVQQSFKNIPSMLYFSPSSVAFDGIGVYAAESLPKGINKQNLPNNYMTNVYTTPITLILDS